MSRIFSGERIENTLAYQSERMKADSLAVSIGAEQISHHRLEQDKVPLQPESRVIVRSASRVHQLVGQELGNPGALSAKSLQQRLGEC